MALEYEASRVILLVPTVGIWKICLIFRRISCDLKVSLMYFDNEVWSMVQSLEFVFSSKCGFVIKTKRSPLISVEYTQLIHVMHGE